MAEDDRPDAAFAGPAPADAPRLLLMPEFMTIGGGQLVYLRRALWLHDHGFHVALASAPGELSEQLSAAGIPYLPLPMFGAQAFYEGQQHLWQDSLRQLVEFVDAQGITVVQAAPIVPILAARELRRVRNVAISCEFLGGQTHLLPPGTCVDGIVRGDFTCGGPGAQHDIAERLGTRPEQVRVVATGVETRRFTTAPPRTVREDLGLGPDDILILNASRHDPDKIAHVLAVVDSVAELAQSRDNLHLLMPGDGSVHAAIAQYARAALGDRVHLPGMVSDLLPTVHGSDIVTAIGSVSYEAALAHKPVILCAARTMVVSDHRAWPVDEYAVGYIGEYDIDTTGDIFDGMVPSSIATRLRPLVDDPTFRAEVAERGFHHVIRTNDMDHAMATRIAQLEELHREAVCRASEHGSPRGHDLYADGRLLAHRPVHGEPALRVAIVVRHAMDDVVPAWERWDRLAAELTTWGIEATIVTRPEGLPQDTDVVLGVGLQNVPLAELWERLTFRRIPVVIVGQHTDDRPIRTAIAAARAVIQAPDVAALADALRSAHAAGVPASGNPSMQTLLDQLWRRLASEAAEYLPSGDEELRQLADNIGVARTTWGHVAAWHEPLPAGDGARARERWGDEPWILCIGGGVEFGQGQALACAAAGDRPVVLMGAPEATYQYTCKRLAGGQLHLVGPTDPQDVADAIAGAAVVVHAGFTCADPGLLGHAEATGVPMAVSEAFPVSWGPDAVVERFSPWSVAAARDAIDRAIAGGPRTPDGAGRRTVAETASSVARALFRQVSGAAPHEPLFGRTLAFVAGDDAQRVRALFSVLGRIGQPDLDFVFVDNASTGATADLLAQLSGDVQVIRLQQRLPADDALELAAARARGRIVSAWDLEAHSDEVLADAILTVLGMPSEALPRGD